MKKYCLFACLFFFVITTSAQRESDYATSGFLTAVHSYLRTPYYFEKDSILSFLRQYEYNYDNDSIYRQIDFGHWQMFFSVSFDKRAFTVYIQGNASKAYSFIVNELIFDFSVEKTLIRRIDPLRLEEYLCMHNNLYQASYTVKNFSPGQVRRYGWGCGGAGTVSDLMLKFWELIEKKDKSTLSLMAASISPEERVIGATGLYVLQKAGVQLTENDKRLVSIAQNSNIPIYYCSGCTEWDSKEMRTLMDAEALDEIYRWACRYFFKKAG